jgi:hypothetical protein
VQRIVRFSVDNQGGQNSGRGAVHTAIIVASTPPALVDMAADHLADDYGLNYGLSSKKDSLKAERCPGA